MAIREITAKLGGALYAHWIDPSKWNEAWEISFNGQTLVLKNYGSFCGWDKLVLEKDKKEVYRIQLKLHENNGRDEGIRAEFFNNMFSRTYKGNQFSFVEYIGLMGIIEKFPTKKGLIRYLRTMERKENMPYVDTLSSKPLKQSLINDYRKKAEQILS